MVFQATFDSNALEADVTVGAYKYADNAVLRAQANTGVKLLANGAMGVSLTPLEAWYPFYLKWTWQGEDLIEIVNEPAAGGSGGGGLTTEEHNALLSISNTLSTQRTAEFKCRIVHKGDYYADDAKQMQFDGTWPPDEMAYTWAMNISDGQEPMAITNQGGGPGDHLLYLSGEVVAPGGRYRYAVVGTFGTQKWTLESGILVVHEV